MRVKKYPDVYQYQQNVPGYTIYGVFWIVSLLAGSVLQEKLDGTFRRLLVAPMHRAAMLAGKLAAYYFINLVQLAIMLGVSSLLFGMSLGYSQAGLVLVSLTLAAAATGLGVLVSAWALDAYQDLLVRGYGLPEVLPKAGVLALFAVVFFR